MSKAQHTPGPWEIINDEGLIYVMGKHNGINSYLCEVLNHSSIDRMNAMEIARLIAEAPTTAAERDKLSEVNKELLDALEELLKHVPVPAVQMGKQFSDPFPVPECIAKARAAIAKANGE